MRISPTPALLLFALAIAPVAKADVKPHSLFTENAVLQQGKPVPVWGSATTGEQVRVRIQDQDVTTTAARGKWMVTLKPLRAGGPYTMTIAGRNTVRLNNVLVGEVWICSGQSNMQWPLTQSSDPDKNIAEANDTRIRLITVPRRATEEPQQDFDGSWQVCSPQTVRDFSAVAYHFARTLRKTLNVPVGLIGSNYGGTPAEAWTRREALLANAGLAKLVESHDQTANQYATQLVNYGRQLQQYRDEAARTGRAAGQPPRAPGDFRVSPGRCSGLYNAMIAPLVPSAIRGAIWYQGESNAGRAHEYRTLFPLMIRNWREDFGQGDFPFLFVQLAPFMRIQAEPKESAWAELREAQTMTMEDDRNTGMAVITDAGDEADIHPKDKTTVGHRLALAALRVAYGTRAIGSGPIYRSVRKSGQRLIVSFMNPGSGLMAKGGDLTGFAICGPDGRYVNAQAAVTGYREVSVWSDLVHDPRHVRFGWADFPVVNLYNSAGLPASPFRSDKFKGVTEPK